MKTRTTIPRNLLILHYHLRPGGVRRVIEMCLPALAKSGVFESITLASGEAPDGAWAGRLCSSIAPVPFAIRVEPALGYLSSGSQNLRHARLQISRTLSRLARPDSLIWAHNLGLGRNIVLASELARFAAKDALPILSHHHDFWFDNRWERWAELRANGFGSLQKVARAIFSTGAQVMHAAINSPDESLIAKQMPDRSAWLPNPSSQSEHPAENEVERARKWLRAELGHRGPIWIFPTRFLRRKNLAEAALLSRWLQPEAFLVTTAGVSSRGEMRYAGQLKKAAQTNGWKVRFSILTGRDHRSPSVPALMCASDNVILTSLQEGFGLPFLEAAALGLPLLARRLRNVVPDLSGMGFRFPGMYDEVHIPEGMYDRKAERNRQELLFRKWKRNLPASCRKSALPPAFLAEEDGEAIPFSRLTIEGQLEVHSIPPAEAWKAALPHNSQLAKIHLGQKMEWPAGRGGLLSPATCASRLLAAVQSMPGEPLTGSHAEAAQRSFMTERLRPEHTFPLLMPS